MKNKHLFISVLPFLILCASCTEGIVPDDGADSADGLRTVTLSFDPDCGTRGTLLAGGESASSGGYVYVFDHENGFLLASRPFDSPGNLSLKVRDDRNVDFYVIGNIRFRSKADGSFVPFDTAFMDTSGDRDELDGFVCRLDGSDYGTKYRHCTMADLVGGGLPYAARLLNQKVTAGATYVLSASYLFAKVTLTVDHSGFNGTGSADLFTNGTVSVNKANARLPLFSDASAQSDADVVAGDFDPAMANAKSGVWTLYVPENVSGTVAGITAPEGKTASAAPARATYIEFKGSLDATAGGYGGDYTYRFYLGANATTDFNVIRGMEYKVTLGFKAGSAFDPYWKVGADEGIDTRLFGLAPMESGESLLKDSTDPDAVIAVRKGRSAKAFIYFNRAGETSSPELSYLDDWTSGYVPADATRSAVRVTADSEELAANGLSMEYSSGAVTVGVSDPSKFVAGRDIPLEVTLYPGAITKTYRLRTFPDAAVSINVDEFYVGMRRKGSITGFVGTPSLVLADFPFSAQSHHFKLCAPGEATDATVTGDYLSKDTPQTAGKTFYLCAYNNSNCFGYETLNPGYIPERIRIVSSDRFNDPELYIDATVKRPYPVSGLVDGGDTMFSIDGTENNTVIWYDKFDVVPTPSGYVMNRLTIGTGEGELSQDVYDKTLRPVVEYNYQGVGDVQNLAEYMYDGNGKIYIRSFQPRAGTPVLWTIGSPYVGDVSLSNKHRLGKIEVTVANREAYPYDDYHWQTTVCCKWPYGSPVGSDNFKPLTTEYFNEFGPSEMKNKAKFYNFGCTRGISLSGVEDGSYSNLGKLRIENASKYFDTCDLIWYFGDAERMADFSAPYGNQQFSVAFRDRDESPEAGTQHVYSARTNSFIIQHNVSLKQYAVGQGMLFRIFVIPAKYAYFFRQWANGDDSYSEVFSRFNVICGQNKYSQYIYGSEYTGVNNGIIKTGSFRCVGNSSVDYKSEYFTGIQSQSFVERTSDITSPGSQIAMENYYGPTSNWIAQLGWNNNGAVALDEGCLPAELVGNDEVNSRYLHIKLFTSAATERFGYCARKY